MATPVPWAPARGKAASAAACDRLEQVPNIGPATAADLRQLGIHHPADLARADPAELFDRLCHLTGQRHDPCVLDTLHAAVDFMRGAPAQPWWAYTARRLAARSGR